MQKESVYSKNTTAGPLVSFIIPDYNVSSGILTECLDSIMSLSLSDKEREIILIDDGSAISPLESIAEYQDKIIYVRQRNQGAAAARNLGIDIARGRYIQFLDADDKLITAPYEHCLDIIRYHDADMVLFNMATEAQDNATVQDFLYDGPVSGTEYMRHNNLKGVPWWYIFRRDMLGTLRFHNGLIVEDEEFTPQLLLRAEKIYTTKAEAYYYRQTPDSMTHKKGSRWTLKRLNDTVEVLEVLRDRADVLPFKDRLALQRRIDQLTADYLYNVITMTHSRHYLERCITRLRKRGFFPLPEHDYTKKYKYFCRLVNSSAGRRLLLIVLRHRHQN